MKKINFCLFLIVIFSYCFAENFNVPLQSRFQDDIHHPNVVIVAFDAISIDSKTGEIDIELNSRGYVQIRKETNKTNVSSRTSVGSAPIQSFNDLADQYLFTSIERMFWVKDQDWHDENRVYPMNIFKITLEDNSMIDEALGALSRDRNIIYATLDTKMTKQYIPNDPNLHLQWYIPIVKADEMWNYIQGDTTIVIAIVDDGMKWNHEDLRDNIFINHAEAPGMTINWDTGVISGGDSIDNDGNGKIDDILGWDFYYNHNQTYQSYEWMIHGTHVGGIAGAVGDNAIGISGIAMNTRLLVSKHGPSHYETSLMTDPWSGILYAADSGSHVINCSWGGLANGQDGLDFSNTVVNYATEKGSIVVAAAGNSNSSSNLFIPANSTNTIAVASSNQEDMKSSFSNYGNHITITAPGSNIYSTFFWESLEDAVDDYYALSGTSMASPLVAGVVAMMLSRNPDLSVEDIKEILIDAADTMIENEAGGYYEGLLGGGRINAVKSVVRENFVNLSLFGEPEILEFEGDNDGVINPGETISISIDIINRTGWADAYDTVASISSDFEGVEIKQGILEFSPHIPSGTTASSLNKAIVYIDDSINGKEIPMTINLTSKPADDYFDIFEKSFTFTISVSLSKANWPLITGGHSPASPMVANLDGTGNRLITFANNHLHIIDVEKKYNENFPLNISESIMSDFAIGDVTRNGNQQIVLVTSNGKLIVISHTGHILNEYIIGNNVRTSPIIADLNNDGFYEIIVGTQNGNLFIFNGNDLSLWDNYPIDIGNPIIANMAVGDVNGDGYKNIVINYGSPQNQGIHVINPMTGENIAGFPNRDIGATLVGATLANFTGGSGLDIVFASSLSLNIPLSIVTSAGNIVRQSILQSSIQTEIAVIDIFRDGVPYIVFGDNSGNIWVKDEMLENVSGFPINVGARIDSSPVFADFDGDGNREIIFGDNMGRVHIIKANGQYIPGYPLQISNSAIQRSPWVGSFDSGRGDILVVVNNGIEYIDTKKIADSPAWYTYRGNIGKTASFTDPRTPENDFVNTIFVNKLEQNYPNPFNPETIIKFSIAEDSQVNIDIYNIRGQKVKNIFSEYLTAGVHQTIWNGTDFYGRKVSSGIYFYRIEAGPFQSTRRMILLK
ncbi:MAG: S8 family serine peptidase [Candidatus Cloacimonetes bacterium]|nr:S8 family serine peptidase [Candidatus Cloacimonadota bacterium]